MEFLLLAGILWAVGKAPGIAELLKGVRNHEVDIVKLVIHEREKQEKKKQKAINKLNRKG